MAYQIIFTATNQLPSPITSADLSCASVSSSLLSAVGSAYRYETWSAVSCSQTPLQLGAYVYIKGSNSGNQNYLISSIVGDSGSPAALSWQDAIAAQNTTIAQLQTQFSTLQTTIGSNGTNPDTLAASSVMFGAFLAAACAVYGVKRIYNLFRTHHGED